MQPERLENIDEGWTSILQLQKMICKQSASLSDVLKLMALSNLRIESDKKTHLCFASSKANITTATATLVTNLVQNVVDFEW